MPTDWRPIIRDILPHAWPLFPLADGVRWIHAQMMAESRGNSLALSLSGAKGLMQLMPATAEEMGVRDPMIPQDNLRGGIQYMKIQYDHFPEIPDVEERYLWSLAAYNGGRAWANRALKCARLDEEPFWWKWTPGRYWLMSRDCEVAGKHPDFRQMWTYVARIKDTFDRKGPTQ